MNANAQHTTAWNYWNGILMCLMWKSKIKTICSIMYRLRFQNTSRKWMKTYLQLLWWLGWTLPGCILVSLYFLPLSWNRRRYVFPIPHFYFKLCVLMTVSKVCKVYMQHLLQAKSTTRSSEKSIKATAALQHLWQLSKWDQAKLVSKYSYLSTFSVW